MKRFLQENDEDARHRKKSKTSKTSKGSNVLTTNTNMKKLSSENLLGMHGVEDAGSVENFGAITVSFLPVAIWISAGRTPLGNKEFPTSPFSA